MSHRIAPTVVRGAKAFGLLLQLLRKMAGYAQADVAAILPCSPGLVSLRETGDRQVTTSQAAAMLELYGYCLVVLHRDDVARLPGIMLGAPDDPDA